MKKLILAGFCVLSVALGNTANAQFTFPKDTVKYAIQGYGSEDIHNDIKNEGTTAVNLTWKVVADNMPASWESAFGFCDNVTCYTGAPDGMPKTMAKLDPNTTSDFKVSMNFTDVISGTYFVTLEVTDGTTTKDMTFFMTKFGTNVSSGRNTNDGISLYPNPAHEELNVLFPASVGIKNITVYNMIGKATTVYKVSGTNSAKMDIQSIPAGIYFIRLTDAQGRVVATRKFTRQ